MSQQSLSAKKMAIMVSAGFDEAQFIAMQKSMMATNGWLKVISNKPGLVNGANGGTLGMAYPVDAVLSETLAIDYDGIIIPGGAAHIEKIAQEPHAIRILKAFMRESMPILMIDEAADLLASIDSEISRDDFASSENLSVIRHVVVASSEATPASMMSAMAQALDYSEEEQAA